jgi:hypothetical protein
MRAFATLEVLGAWSRVCPAGPRVFGPIATAPRADGGRHLWTACPLSGAGLVDAALAARTDALPLAAALVVADQLGQDALGRELVAFFVDASPAPTGGASAETAPSGRGDPADP